MMARSFGSLMPARRCRRLRRLRMDGLLLDPRMGAFIVSVSATEFHGLGIEQVRKGGLPPLMGESGGEPPFLTCSSIDGLISVRRSLQSQYAHHGASAPPAPSSAPAGRL